MPGPRTKIGNLDFAFQQFTHGTDITRQRPVKVSGFLSAYTNTPSASPPLSHHAGGDTAHASDAMEGYDKGHVIAVNHSNVSDPENIVPMYPCFNQAGGAWRELELSIDKWYKNAVPTRGSPRILKMTVEIEYAGTDPRFPTAFLVTLAEHDKNASVPAFYYFKGAKLDRMRLAHLPMPPATIDPVAELGGDVLKLIGNAVTYVNTTGWKVESLYPNAKLATHGSVPRPYAALDLLWLHPSMKDSRIAAFLTDGTVYRDGFAAQFHERQKQLIRIVNAAYNKGKIKSDYPGDTKDDLIVGSGHRAAQIDHVFPYSEFGGNLFSNALVASGAFNNTASAMKPADKWKYNAGVTLYSTSRHL